ncbi:MAG: hypothetical protein WC548_03070 [Candidatus Pacearchaeota archaeon]
MVTVIDMQLMRYINLFSRISNVSTKNCFVYNGQIVFAVPSAQVSQAIGRDATNVKKLRDILRKKIKIVAMPAKDNKEGIAKFVGSVVEPLEFNSIEVKDSSITINAGRQSKAALIGRNRTREKELSDVLKNYFGLTKLKIA